ncbi:MAG TPA: tetratricopeptide repeat protein [Phycisphaerae bacterium]|nr:tetratricopeptide repeat protein [Phycisphaerae bacterium]
MAKVIKPVRRATQRPIRLMGWALGLRRPPGHRPDAGTSIEVWQWTRSKYRLRAFLLLSLDAVLFAGLGAFALWLRTGQYFMSSSQQYWRAWWDAFDPTLEQQLTLLDYLIRPIPVDQVPLMMVILGLVMASLTAVPILVSMLYRLPYALIFTGIICFVAMLPWLAVTVTLCCFVARWRPMRFSFHYATALIALLPVLVYYALATRNAAVSEVLPPLEVAKLYLPWVLAVVAACVVMAVVLLIAWLVSYRPGAIAPLMAVLFAAPVVLFEVEVGRDELYYRLIEANFGPGSTTHFVDNVDASEAIRRLARQRRSAGSAEAAEEQVALELQLRGLAEAFAQQQAEAVHACRSFRSKFPRSRYVPNVLYMEGRALDMRINQELFREQAMLRYHSDFPSMASETAWRELHERFPQCPLWSHATLRLAQLEARQGRVDEAIGLLDKLDQYQERKDVRPEPPAGRLGAFRSFFAKRPASLSLGVDVAAVIQEERKLRWLLAHNRDPQQNDAALRRLLGLDPHHAMYRQNLALLMADLPVRYPLTPLGDNVDVLIAATERSQSRKIEQLRACVDRLSQERRSDALPQARYELGLAYKQDNRPAEARGVFEEVLRLYPDSPWAFEASRQLASMGIVARLAPTIAATTTQPL